MNTECEERNPFPEPQTMPSGWDLSALLSALKPDSAPKAEDPAENESS